MDFIEILYKCILVLGLIWLDFWWKENSYNGMWSCLVLIGKCIYK